MAFNESLADRVRQNLAAKNIEAEEKKMFGGLAFMINGKMGVGIVKDDLMVRCLVEKQDWALEQTGCRDMDFTGKPMKGFLFVDETGFPNEKHLSEWVDLGVEFVFAPPPKKGKASKLA